MKRYILTACMIFSGILVSVGQTTSIPTTPPTTPVSENPNAPEIVFDKDVHDFGTLENGGNGTYEFRFKNAGKEPLIISNARGSCGCTVPTWPKEPIMPGKSSTIKVTYDTKRTGNFTKQVTITSNAKTANKVITIKGTVKPAPSEETFPGKKMGEGSPFEK